ncbi:MAG: TolC family protein, partial [Verrucomicrobia bacterium]|nr:TolC family protein [Verrucomicrobiota bacterium]
MTNNPEIAAARWDAESSAAQYDLAFGERLPSVRVQGGYSHYLDNQRLIAATDNNEPGLFGRDIVAGEIIVSVPLFTGGRLINQVKAAQLLQMAATHRLTRTREEIVFNVSSAFFNILAQNRVIESLTFSRQTLQEHLKRVDALISAQKAAKVDGMRTGVRLADIEQRLVREENLRMVFHRVLVNLLGLKNPPGAISLSEGLTVNPKEGGPDLETALTKAWASRGDFLSARSALEAQSRSLDSARAAHWPALSFQTAYGRRWSTGETLGPDKLSNPDDTGRIWVVVDIPLFEGGRVEAKIRDQQAKLASAQERFRKLESQICLEVETSLLNVNSSRERIEVTQKAVEQAQESYRIELLKYDAGKGAIVDVLDA